MMPAKIPNINTRLSNIVIGNHSGLSTQSHDHVATSPTPANFSPMNSIANILQNPMPPLDAFAVVLLLIIFSSMFVLTCKLTWRMKPALVEVMLRNRVVMLVGLWLLWYCH